MQRANYQGESLGLRLNGEAVHQLREALEDLSSFSWRSSREVPLRLPDGRTLTLRVSLSNDGQIRDEHGNYLDDDGLAYGDVYGDLHDHADADRLIDAACYSSLHFELNDRQLAGEEPVDLDAVAAARVDAALDRLPYRYGRKPEWAEAVRERGLSAARAALPRELERTRATWQTTQAQRSPDTVGNQERDPLEPSSARQHAPGEDAGGADGEDGDREAARSPGLVM